MPQRVLALEIDAHELKGAVIETTFRDYRVVGFYREDIAADGNVSDQVRSLVERHKMQPGTVLSSIPGDLVAFRTLFLPFRDRKRLDQTVPFELENQVPFGLDEVVVDYHVLRRDRSGTVVLAALVQRKDLQQHLALLGGAGLDPKVVDLAPLAALNVLTLLGAELPENFVYIDGNLRRTVVALYRGRQLVGLRTLTPAVPATADEVEATASGNGHADAEGALVKGLVGEIRWTLLALNGGPIESGLPCLLAGGGPHCDQLGHELARQVGVVVRRLTESRLRNVPPALQTEVESFAAPLGLALREVAPNGAVGVNFRQGEFAYHRGQDELRRALWRTGALAALVVALVIVNTYMSYEQVAGRLDALQVQIRDVFTRTLPDVHRVVDERAQLKSEIEAAQKHLQILGGLAPVSGVSAIDVLRTITAAIPENIKIDTDEYIMDPEAVRIKAKTDSFEAVDTIKQQLLNTHYFGDVQVKEVKNAPDGKVDFRLVLALNKDVSGSAGAATKQ
jgi:type II secretory pathway component PulL